MVAKGSGGKFECQGFASILKLLKAQSGNLELPAAPLLPAPNEFSALRGMSFHEAFFSRHDLLALPSQTLLSNEFQALSAHIHLFRVSG